MNAIFKFFTYKKVATLNIKCVLPYSGSFIEFYMKCKLYENKYGDRKINFPIDQYPLTNLRNNKDVITKFLDGKIISFIPSYNKVKEGFVPPILDDIATIYD